jgi:hypothetical protein
MRLRLLRVVPNSIPKEAATGSLDETEQIIYLALRDSRRPRTGQRPTAQREHEA